MKKLIFKTCKSRHASHRFRFPSGVPIEKICNIKKTESSFDHFQYTRSIFDFGDEDIKYQLPKTIVATHYTLCLKPNLDYLIFEGCVAIQCIMPNETRTVTMNVGGILLGKIVWADEATGIRQEAAEFNSNPAEQRMTIVFSPRLTAGHGVLIINFKGRIQESHMDGLYASSYHNEFEEINHNALTKFSHAEARQCFPCFDEPGLKATFAISFVVPRTVTIICNTPIKTTYPHRSDKTLHIVEFETTPKMSTYLLAFAIGQFEFIENRGENNKSTVCRIYGEHLPDEIFVNYMLETCQIFLNFFTNYFDIPFPMKKLDIIAETKHLPGAMDSWGLFTFKESGLLIPPNTKSNVDEVNLDARINTLMTLSHVLCHQWLGNLVTIKWWTHLWLYEAIGTFMEYYSIDILEPKYLMWMRFVTNVYIKALEMDALSHVHMIETPIHQPSELKENHDSLSFNKGAAIIGMLQTYIGNAKFQQGITKFLTKFAYGNATATNFWEILEEVSDKPITAIMTSWTKQAGFPLIRVIASRTENKGRVITLHQEVFIGTDLAAKSHNAHNLWMIPISISLSTNPKVIIKELLMDKRTVSFKLPKISEMDWYKINPGIRGFYRVKYPQEMFGQFLQAVRSKALPPMDRLGLLNDTYAFAEAGFNSCVDVLTILETFVDEDNFFVWKQIDSVINGLDRLLYPVDCYKKFKFFAKSIFKHIYLKVGWDVVDGESNNDVKLRELVLTRLLMLGHAECEEEGFLRFEKFMNGEFYPMESRSVLYKAGMIKCDQDTFEAIIRRFRTIESIDERNLILESLGFSMNEVILHEILDYAVSEFVRHEDTLIVMKSVVSNVIGKHIAWKFFKDRFNILAHRYALEGGRATQLLKTITDCFSTEDMHTEIAEFFRHHHFHISGADRTIAQSLEKIHNFASWLKREKLQISDYLLPYDL